MTTYQQVNDLKNKKINWNAQWIWEQEHQRKTFSYVCFRKIFNVGNVASCAMLHITANNNYHLFLNGKRVGIGPAFSHSRFKRFESYDVNALLTEGANCLSVIVHHDDENDSVDPEYKGLLCQLDFDGKSVCVSDSSWATHSCRAYQAPRVKMGYTFWAEFFDAGAYPHGWTECDFNDSLWLPAVAVKKSFSEFWQCEQNQARVFPWTNLICSELEPLKYTKRHPTGIIREGEVVEKRESSCHDTAVRMSLEPVLPISKASLKDTNSLLGNSGTVLIRNSNLFEKTDTFNGIRRVTIILDFGQISNARLGFRLTSCGKTTVDIGYSNQLEENRIIPYLSYSTPMADQYSSIDGEQVWQGFDYRQFRYVQLTFRGNFDEVKLHEIWAEQVEYPFVLKGGFECDDPLINRAVNAARLSTKLNVIDRTMDNASREQRYHIGDCTSILRSIWSFFGQCGIVKRHFRHAEESRQITGGYERAAGLKGVVIDHELDFPPQIYEYYMISGDLELLEEMWPGLELMARFIESCIEKNGMIESIPCLQYYDWGDVKRNKHNFLLNAYAAKALESTCLIFQEIGIEKSVKRRLEMVRIIHETLREKWYAPSKGVFLDNPYVSGEKNHISEHTNSLAIYYDIASPEQVLSICQAYENHHEWFAEANAGWKFMPGALLKAGRADLFTKWVHSHFGKWFDNGIESVAECWSMYGETTQGHWRTRNSRAVAQAAGVVGLPFALLQELCGISPQEPGFKTVRFAPNPGGLKCFKGDFPIERGSCSLSYKCTGNKHHIDISVPESINIVLDLRFCSPEGKVSFDDEPRSYDELYVMPNGDQIPRFYINEKKSVHVVASS